MIPHNNIMKFAKNLIDSTPPSLLLHPPPFSPPPFLLSYPLPFSSHQPTSSLLVTSFLRRVRGRGRGGREGREGGRDERLDDTALVSNICWYVYRGE